MACVPARLKGNHLMPTTSTGKPQMSDEAIRNGSGKSWAEWVEVLDAWGAADKSHPEIARHVHDLGVGDWWAQGVTIGYERIKGLRAQGQSRDGLFEGSASKTFPVPVERLQVAWTDESERDMWLEPGTLTLRTARDGRSARFDVANDGGILALWFTDKGPDKSSVQLQLDKLPSQEAAVEFRETWQARLADLANHLKG